MEELYQFINSNLSRGILLKDIKDDLFSFCSPEVIKYCEQKANYTTGKYNRIKLTDYSNEIFEIILICWDTGSETRIHDHPDKGCALQLMKGCLQEHLYDSNIKLKKINTIISNNTSYMENSIGYHKIKCIDAALSLHIYSPPNHKMKILE